MQEIFFFLITEGNKYMLLKGTDNYNNKVIKAFTHMYGVQYWHGELIWELIFVYSNAINLSRMDNTL